MSLRPSLVYKASPRIAPDVTQRNPLSRTNKKQKQNKQKITPKSPRFFVLRDYTVEPKITNARFFIHGGIAYKKQDHMGMTCICLAQAQLDKFCKCI